MRSFKIMALASFAFLFVGCSANSTLIFAAEEGIPLGKTVMFTALEDETDTSIPVLFRARHSMDESLRLRLVYSSPNTGGPAIARVGLVGFSRVLDSVPHIQEGDLIVTAVPPDNDWDYESGRVPVIIEMLCKAEDKACLERHKAPKRHFGTILRRLEPGEFEAYTKPENFSVYFTKARKNRKLVKPLP